MMEDIKATQRTPEKTSLDYLSECDVFIGIYAHRYGFIPSRKKKSITQQEYDLAKKENKDILCFIII